MRLNDLYVKTPGLLDHSLRVFFFTRQVIDYLPGNLITREQAEDLLQAALYHDIGKSTWQNDWFVLPKNSIRSSDWTVMQTHPIQSINILRATGIPITEGTRKYILRHHERPGGTGYPYKIEPDFYSLILAAADVFCACTEHRSYRPYPLDTGQAFNAVSKFAPEIITDALKFAVKKIA